MSKLILFWLGLVFIIGMNLPEIIREIHIKKLYLLKEGQASNWPKALTP